MAEILTSESNILTGCVTIDETKQNLLTAYEEIVAAGDFLLLSLEGDVKTAFTSAKETTEREVDMVAGVFAALSLTLTDYAEKSSAIDLNAGILAGGGNNE